MEHAVAELSRDCVPSGREHQQTERQQVLVCDRLPVHPPAHGDRQRVVAVAAPGTPLGGQACEVGLHRGLCLRPGHALVGAAGAGVQDRLLPLHEQRQVRVRQAHEIQEDRGGVDVREHGDKVAASCGVEPVDQVVRPGNRLLLSPADRAGEERGGQEVAPVKVLRRVDLQGLHRVFRIDTALQGIDVAAGEDRSVLSKPSPAAVSIISAVLHITRDQRRCLSSSFAPPSGSVQKTSFCLVSPSCPMTSVCSRSLPPSSISLAAVASTSSTSNDRCVSPQ